VDKKCKVHVLTTPISFYIRKVLLKVDGEPKMSEKEHDEMQLRIMKDILSEYERLKMETPSQRDFYDKRILHRQKMINLLEEKLGVVIEL